jgi:hypothetical protein
MSTNTIPALRISKQKAQERQHKNTSSHSPILGIVVACNTTCPGLFVNCSTINSNCCTVNINALSTTIRTIINMLRPPTPDVCMSPAARDRRWEV